MKALAVVLLLSPILYGATYIVPEDRRIIEESPAIVIGTIAGSHARRAHGRIETVTEVRIAERIKGPLGAPIVAVVHAGGQIGEEWMMQSGAPVFESGERVLLFLRRNSRGDWTTYALGLGVFRFRGNALTRGDEIVGWDEHGQRHVERVRVEGAFLDYVRAVVRGEERSPDYFGRAIAGSHVATHATFTSGSYTGRFRNAVSTPIRRRGNDLTISWRLIGAQPGLDMVRAVDAGIAAWNGQSALIHYSRSEVPASGDRVDDDDAEHRIIANDPHDEIDNGCCVGAVAFSSGSGTHSFNDETFRNIEHSDIVVNDTMTGASEEDQRWFDALMTHELGHTLGLRHANQDNTESAVCTLPRDCCFRTVAGGDCMSVMDSDFLGAIVGLQYWDKKAIDCVFHAICVSTTSCNPPEIRLQPRSRELTRGLTGQLSVIAAGTPPLRYQWYAGTSGDTSTPVGTNSPTLRVTPQSTTSYWARVIDPCGNEKDSDAATITIIPCPFLSVTSAYAFNVQEAIMLDASATGAGLEYEWFRGTTPGEGGTPVSAQRVARLTITEPASFWVRVTNSCGATAVSDLVFAAPCGLPSIVAQPQSRTIAAGAQTTITVALLATVAGDVVWYRGLPQDPRPIAVGTGPDLVVTATTTTTYWGTVTNACGEVPIRMVTVYVTASNTPSRGRRARH